jgi:hypothetical protein
MEDNTQLLEHLRNKMAVELAEISHPPVSKIEEARKLVQNRLKKSKEREDFITMLASFLNMRIKLYHAVIVTILVGVVILLSTKNSPSTNEANTSAFDSNIAAVRNNTILPSINTFVMRK